MRVETLFDTGVVCTVRNYNEYHELDGCQLDYYKSGNVKFEYSYENGDKLETREYFDCREFKIKYYCCNELAIELNYDGEVIMHNARDLYIEKTDSYIIENGRITYRTSQYSSHGA